MPAENQALLIWDPVTTNQDATPITDLAGYIVYAGRQPSVDSDISALIPTPTVTYTFTPPVNGDGLWHFQVAARDINNNTGAKSNLISQRVIRVSGKFKVRR